MNQLLIELQPYARHHQDRRNNMAHFLGISLSLLALSMLLAQPTVILASLVWLNPAIGLSLLCVALYYRRFGWLTALGMALLLLAFNALGLALLSTVNPSLEWNLGLFAMGWAIPLLGHLLEGSKPAFMDDWHSVLLGPLYMACQLLFALGLLRGLKTRLSQEAKPERTTP